VSAFHPPRRTPSAPKGKEQEEGKPKGQGQEEKGMEDNKKRGSQNFSQPSLATPGSYKS